MSFLGDLINTIGGDRAPAPPAKPPTKPVLTNISPVNTSKSGPTTPTTASQSKPVYKGTAGSQAPPQGNVLKRKADDVSSDRPVKALKPSLNPNSDISGQNPSKINGADTKAPASSSLLSNRSIPISNNSNATKPPAKAPSKGSYAAMMARAKEAQQVKTPSQIGMIKHQATDKIKTSKLAERKKEEQEKAKAPATVHPSKAGQKGKIDPRRRSASPIKKTDAGASKQLKAPRPPLHGPAPASAPAYKGTMNSAPNKSREEMQRKKPRKYDEYLGTDEEDDDDDGYGYGGDDYNSDEASDDMEGGFDDMMEEDRAAERAARDEDAREMALEAKLKREKLERKQKLTTLAQKKK